MPGIILPQRWRQMPSQPAEVDRSHPLARGLIECIVPAWQRSSLLRIAPTRTSSFSYGQRQGGTARLTPSGLTVSDQYPSALLRPAIGFSHFGLYRLTAVPSVTWRVAGTYQSTTGGYLLSPSTTNFRAVVADAATPIVLTGSAVHTRLKADLHVVASTTSASYYENGVLTASAGSVAYAAGSTNYYIGADPQAVVSAGAEHYLYALWSRPLGAAEAEALWENPWQMFRPTPARIWSLPAPSSAAAPSIVATTQELQTGSTDTITLAVPAGSGDVYVLAVSNYSSSATFTWPAGFTELAQFASDSTVGVEMRVATRARTGSESGSFVATKSGYAPHIAQCYLLAGVNATPVAASALGTSPGYVASHALTGGSVTVDASGRSALWIASTTGSGTPTPSYPSGLTAGTPYVPTTSVGMFTALGGAGSAGSQTYSGSVSYTTSDTRISLVATLVFAASSSGAVTGASSQTLGVVTQAASGAVGTSGASAATLGAIVSAAAAVASISGAGAAAIGAIGAVAAGGVASSGAAAVTLAGVASAAAGTIGTATVIGSSAVTLGGFGSTSAAIISTSGAQAAALGLLAAVSAGQVATTSAQAQALQPVTGAGAAAVLAAGSSSAALGPVVVVSSGSARLAGQSGLTLGAVQSSIAGTVAVRGAASINLGPVAQQAGGSPPAFVPALARIYSPSHTTLLGIDDRRLSYTRPAVVLTSPERASTVVSPDRTS